MTAVTVVIGSGPSARPSPVSPPRTPRRLPSPSAMPGFDVTTAQVDVSSRASVHALAERAARAAPATGG